MKLEKLNSPAVACTVFLVLITSACKRSANPNTRGSAWSSVLGSLLVTVWLSSRQLAKSFVCVFFPFILDVRLVDVPAGITHEEGHTGFLIHLLSAVLALIFLARRIQPFLSLEYKLEYLSPVEDLINNILLQCSL